MRLSDEAVSEPNFRREKGGINFYLGDELVMSHPAGQTLAFVFNAVSGAIYQQGSLEYIQCWLIIALREWRDAGLIRGSNDYILISAPVGGVISWDLDLVNKFVQNTGYIGRWYALRKKANPVSHRSGLLPSRPLSFYELRAYNKLGISVCRI